MASGSNLNLNYFFVGCSLSKRQRNRWVAESELDGMATMSLNQGIFLRNFFFKNSLIFSKKRKEKI